MFDQKKLEAVITAYKAYFPEHWKDERYKWEAVWHFQKNWDIHAPNFLEMFMEATDKTFNLLANMNNYPRGMIKAFATADAEAVRGMYIQLFDESKNLAERIEQFQASADEMRVKYDDGTWKQHYQTANAISTYLWLRYPDKYYIYKYSEVRSFANEINSDFYPKKNRATENVEGSYKFYDEIRKVIVMDHELDKLLNEALKDSCYPDPEKITMTIDLGFFVSRFYHQEKEVTQCEQRSISEKDLTYYTKQDFLSQVYMSEERYDTLVMLLKNKKNLILQGAPGVGKTFAAKRLAYSMMGKKDEERIELIQFHQNYSYEDFIMGYRPQEEGFKLTEGIFYQFCMKATEDPDQDYFFIIDEINRGNMSKIFGELLMLIEKDYRGTAAKLAYSGKEFFVPKNLYIIGMMNTADRSLAMIDYALRRRFSFFEMKPGFHSDGFQAYQASLQNETFHALIEQIIDLNREIKMDDSLGEGFCIGHSYFCGQQDCTEEWMKSVVYYDIIPMLREYWFDDKQKVQRWENLLSGVFND
jgi:MoxR-like ATPase